MTGASSILVGLIAAVVHGLDMLALLRLAPRTAPMKLHAASGFGCHIAGSVVGAALVSDFNYWTAAAVYWFCFMSYLYVYSAFYKSISLKILRNTVARPDRTITLAEIYRIYVHPGFTQRVDILVAGGMAEAQGAAFVPTAAGQATAGRIRRLQRLFGIERFGLYFTGGK